MDQYDMIIYHADCTDGWCSAWIATRAGCQGAELIPAYYGQPPPDVKGRRVLVVDFSYPRSIMLDLHCSCIGKLTVLDHHKTAKEALTGFSEEAFGLTGVWPEVVFDMNKSGARLCWEHFHGTKTPLPIVSYVEDRDLWEWEMAGSKEINAAIRSYPMDVQTWDSLSDWLNTDPQRLLRAGEGIIRYQEQVISQHVDRAVEMDVAGHTVLAVNATVLFSEIAGALAKGRPFGVAWFVRKDGNKVYSLRSDKNGLDVSIVAKSKGGGGHVRAAGFEE